MNTTYYSIKHSYEELDIQYDDTPSTSEEEKENFEIDVKPKKKCFQSDQEKQQFIEEYTKKKKTELCKNFTLTNKCKFGSKCSFAHGKSELQPKTHLHSKYKTKPCQNYFSSGYCSYGLRCQYLHEEYHNKSNVDTYIKQCYQECGYQIFSRQKQYNPEIRKDLQNFQFAMKKFNVELDLINFKPSKLTSLRKITEQF